MVMAYLRVSTERQLLENQRNEIVRFAEGRELTIQKWQMEKISGKATLYNFLRQSGQ